MPEAELPPPYSLEVDQEPVLPVLTARPSLYLRPSASFLSPHPSPLPSPRPSPSPSPSSKVSLPPSDASSSALPPSYLDSSVFASVTKRVKRPLVTVERVGTHLRLMRAFKLFRERVEDPYSDPAAADLVPPVGRSIGTKGRWLWFLEMAVERFRRWLMLLATADGFFVTPPVDVWLIWHVYMLNPTWYMEDCERSWFLRPLRNLRDDPMDLAAKMGDDILNYRPTVDQDGLWEADLDVDCPKCERPINVSFVNTEGTGFAQSDFVTVCPFCDTLVTRESLGVAKFIKDLVLDPDDNSHVQMHGKGVYLPGTLLLRSGSFNTPTGRRLKSLIRNLHVFRNENAPIASKIPYHNIEQWKKAIGDRLRYSGTELRKSIDQAGIGSLSLSRKIIGAYVDGKPFSVELVAAAMRQATFTDKIHQLGWLEPEFFESPESAQVVQQSILRYYGFLTLIEANPEYLGSFVPTLDIDLAWHTHQLSPVIYSKDCRNVLGRLLDHDDQIEEGSLANGLDLTSKAWQTQFGVPYMYCGCPLQETTVGQRLSRATSAFFLNRNRIEPPMDRDDCYSATHPSEHNAVHIIGKSARARDLREAEWRRRREKEGEKIGKGKRSKNAELEERYLRGRSHEFPFLMPVPKAHGYGCPHAQRSYAPACVAGVVGGI